MADRGELLAMADAAAARHGVPANIFRGLVAAESNWNPAAVPRDSDGNLLSSAKGLTQLIDGTARSLGVQDPFDPEQNLNGGAKYLGQLYQHFGDWDTAIAAYHDGPGKVAKEGITDDTGRPYVDWVRKHVPASSEPSTSAQTAEPKGWTLETAAAPAETPSTSAGWTLEDAPAGSSAGGAFTEHAANSALLGFGDELVGGYKALAEKVLPQSMGGAPPGAPMADTYRQRRDEVRARLAEEKVSHPAAALAGDLVGGAAPAIALPGAATATLPRVLATAATAGGAAGLGNSDVDLTKGGNVPYSIGPLDVSVPPIAAAALDTAKGATAGAATAGALHAVAPIAGRLAAPVRDFAINQGRRVLTGGANTLSTKVPIAAEAVEEAFKQGAIRPLGTTKNAAEALDAARAKVGDIYGRIVAALEAQGIRGPDAQALAQSYLAEAASVDANTMNPAVANAFQAAADSVGAKPTDATGHLGLSQAENLKRSLQGMAKSAYEKLEPTEVGDAHTQAASMMRQAVEDSIDQGAKASGDPVTKAIASQFVPVKQQLGRIIEASKAATKGAAQASGRRVISPSDYIAAAGGGAPAAVANHVLRTRGTSTAAWAARGVADRLRALAATNPGRLGPYAAILVPALAKSPQDFDANMFVLGQTDPKFQDFTKKLSEEQ